MKIDILCRDGSPIGVTPSMIYGTPERVGVGGSELALLTMCEWLAKKGHEVVLYNDPLDNSSEKYGFEQRKLYSYVPQENRDVLITFRSPNEKTLCSKGYKVWWSCDQYTNGSFKQFAPEVDKIILISEFHRNYFKNVYGIVDNIYVTDLPVRLEDYELLQETDRINNRFIFNSVPDRGLEAFRRIWNIIIHTHADAQAVITSDYRLWGSPSSNTEGYRVKWASLNNFEYLGAISRCRMVQEQLRSEYCLYPCTYDELFCIAAAENQVAGIKTITTPTGALSTTNMFRQVAVDPLDPRNDITFANTVFQMMEKKDEYDELAKQVSEKAKARFNPEFIVDKWISEVFQ